MRSSKYDPIMFLIMVGLFLYFFLVVGLMEVTIFNPVTMQYEIVPAWHGGVILAPLLALMYFCFMLFEEELRPVNRRWVKHKIVIAFNKLRNHCRSGLQEYKEWKGK